MSVFEEVRRLKFPDVLEMFLPNMETRKKGRNTFGLCPLHSEKTPSFTIYEDGFKCWGCGAAGNSVSFVSQLEGINPLEAARKIARAFHINETVQPSGKVRELTWEREQKRWEREYHQESFRRQATMNDILKNHIRTRGLDASPCIIQAQIELENNLNNTILGVGAVGEEAENQKDKFF